MRDKFIEFSRTALFFVLLVWFPETLIAYFAWRWAIGEPLFTEKHVQTMEALTHGNARESGLGNSGCSS